MKLETLGHTVSAQDIQYLATSEICRENHTSRYRHLPEKPQGRSQDGGMPPPNFLSENVFIIIIPNKYNLYLDS